MPLAVAPLVVLRDMGPLPGTSLRHTVWRKGMRMVVYGPNTPLRAADFSIPGQMITVAPEGFAENQDVLAKAVTIIIKFAPGVLVPNRPGQPGTIMNWTVDNIVAYSKICTHVGCPVALYEQTTHHILCPCHQSTFDATNGAQITLRPRAAAAAATADRGRRGRLPDRDQRLPRTCRSRLSGRWDEHVTGKLLGGTGRWFDDRLRASPMTRTFLRKIFPDHWSFLLGEIALYSFIILLLTGTFLTLFFQPSMTDVVYHGSYTPLDGVHMSEAYASTLNISFDVRGGLLMRQIHHWAAILFVAAIVCHLLRIFFTGAFRKPRELNWLIGVVMFTLAFTEGLFGYSLPDDLLSGTGLRILEGVLLSIPIVGTYLTFFLFGGEFPGHLIIPRLYVIHILLIPAPAAGADHRAPVADVAPEAHPDAGQGPHRHQRGRPARVPVLHGEDRRLVLLHLRRDRAAVHLRADQPDLDLRPVQPLRHLGGLPAGLVHGVPGGRPADVAKLALERRGVLVCLQRVRARLRAARHNHDRAGASGRSSNNGSPATAGSTMSTTGRATRRPAPPSAWPA